MSALRVMREDDFDFGSEEYAALYEEADATPFQHGSWLSVLYEVLAPRRNAAKVVVAVRDAGGRLVLVLPLVLRRQGLLRVLEFADLGVSDYAALVAAPELRPALRDSNVIKEIRQALGRFDVLRIERVADSPDDFLAVLAGARARRHGYDTHMIDLQSTTQEWYEGLDSQFVRHLERKYKRLRPKGARQLRLVTEIAEVEPLMTRMQEFRAARFSERRGVDLVQDDDCFAFYCAAARASVPAGPGRLVALEVAGAPVAVAFDLADGDRELFLLVGYDVQRLRNYSLGLLIVDELVRAAIGRGVQHFDLTVGDESYKSDFGARARPLFEIRLRRTPLGVAAVFARDRYLESRRLAKRVLSAWEKQKRQRESARQQAAVAGDAKSPSAG